MAVLSKPLNLSGYVLDVLGVNMALVDDIAGKWSETILESQVNEKKFFRNLSNEGNCTTQAGISLS